ncbi:zinc finger MYM-type protein 1-like [Salvia splendens]|uniref:zinc finger MYM-type protein 1-like n=1 Tax=Salvia splendens TaxID=180675 RepID=UPI001C2523C9|nr:zinc finger MYM-type protein 1-like [Salvia splendens]
MKEAIWLKGVLSELKFVKLSPIVFSDSQSAIQLCKNSVFHDRTKHIDVRFHYIRDIVEKGEVFLQKVHTDKNPADMGTKSLPVEKLLFCIRFLHFDLGIWLEAGSPPRLMSLIPLVSGGSMKVGLKRMKKQSDLRNMFKRMKSHDSSSSSAPNDNMSPSNASASLAPPNVTVTPSNVSVSPTPSNVTVTPSNASVSPTRSVPTHNEVVSKVTLENAPGNCQLISPTIQKDIINCCAKETTKQIVEELGVDYFDILADESSDVSQKEQLSLCLRYVQRKMGQVAERFIGLAHVGDTTALSLRSAIISLLIEHSFSPSKIQGQGYDGASNMKGEIHGLKTLIMEDTPSAYYVHCFAHQLQLTLVAIAKKNDECAWLFDTIANLLNVVGVSCQRRELIREIQARKLAQALEIDELETGSGVNQELGLKRPRDTRWSSHYKTLLNVVDLFSTIVKVLMIIGKNGSKSDDKCKAQGILYSMESFDFVFMAQLMTTIFGYTNNLCLALQRRDQDIINAMRLVSLTKSQLQKTREDGWEIHLNKVISFCNNHGIVVPDLEACYVPHRRSKRFVQQVSYRHHFRIDVFIECVPKLATFYPSDFSSIDLRPLDCQLDIFMEDVRRDNDFQNLQDLSSLSMKFVETNRDVAYPFVFLLIKLILILPVATASVERVFSGMTFVKNKLRNKIGDKPSNDCLVTFIEKEMFLQVSDDDIAHRFEEMKTRRKIN